MKRKEQIAKSFNKAVLANGKALERLNDDVESEQSRKVLSSQA